MNSDTPPTLSGQLLVSDFQTVFSAMAMTQAAQFEAERSESELLNALATVGNTNYLTPGTITPAIEQDITRSSLDAHIKKVQAKQLESLSANQLSELVAQVRNAYIGRKIIVTPLSPAQVPIDSVWFDSRNGYRSSQMKKAKKISGIIEDVLLDRNTLVLKPPRSMRFLNSSLKNYVVYVIDPATLQPMVGVTLI